MRKGLSFVFIVVSLLASSCATSRPDRPGLDVLVPELETIRLRVETHDGDVVSLELDEYVREAVLPEAALANLDPEPALRVAQVQAILARTYALSNRQRHRGEGFDLCSTTHCQVRRPVADWPDHLIQLAARAVRSTSGVVVAYDGAPINAVFHADCGGHTSDAHSVWRGSNPAYLHALPDAYCVRRSTELVRLLNDNVDTAVGDSLDTVVVTHRDTGGRAAHLTLRGQHAVVVRGEELRAAIVSGYGPRSIKSTRFSVHPTSGGFVFEGRGFGHGVGLCQTGAMSRAEAGHSPHDILTHYYPGATLGTLRGASRRTQ
jgi:stage II sporulation protein D